MRELTRRQLLAFFGVTAGATALSPSLGRLVFSDGRGGSAEANFLKDFTPVRLPHPLPVYQTKPSFLATGIESGVLQGTVLPAAIDPSLASFSVVDEVVIPPEYEKYVIVRWGDRVFPIPEDYVGYNHDYTAFIPRREESRRDGFLWINHEYVSFPFSDLAPEAPADVAGLPTSFEAVIGFALPDERNLEFLGEVLYNTGGSILRVRRNRAGTRWSPVTRPTDGSMACRAWPSMSSAPTGTNP